MRLWCFPRIDLAVRSLPGLETAAKRVYRVNKSLDSGSGSRAVVYWILITHLDDSVMYLWSCLICILMSGGCFDTM